MNIIAIILARGGSKGIPKKNTMNFCGKPLIGWTIEACLKGGIKSVWVSSDSDEILEISKSYGAGVIKRPAEFSDDTSSSEIGWSHAIDFLKRQYQVKIDWIIAPQITSPFTEAKDISKAISIVKKGNHDSYFSCSPVNDLFIWNSKNNKLKSLNYDWKNRKRRQEIDKQYVENGAFYIFQPNSILIKKNRFEGNIGCIEMDSWKIFEIDHYEDVEICKILMQNMIIK